MFISGADFMMIDSLEIDMNPLIIKNFVEFDLWIACGTGAKTTTQSNEREWNGLQFITAWMFRIELFTFNRTTFDMERSGKKWYNSHHIFTEFQLFTNWMMEICALFSPFCGQNQMLWQSSNELNFFVPIFPHRNWCLKSICMEKGVKRFSISTSKNRNKLFFIHTEKKLFPFVGFYRLTHFDVILTFVGFFFLIPPGSTFVLKCDAKNESHIFS